jgi:subtilisin family serine protease
MKRISFLGPWMVCLLFTSCGLDPFETFSAPKTQEDAGVIASCTDKQEAQDYAKKYGVKYRVLNEKSGILEIFDKDIPRMKRHFKKSKLTVNQVYNNLIDTSSSSPLKSSSTNFDHLRQIRATEISHKAGEGVVIAIIDTGVSYQHSDLSQNLWSNDDEILNGIDDDNNGVIDDIHGWDYVNGDNDPRDDNDHGTHVAGLAVGKKSGVANRAKFMPIKVLDHNGSGDLGSIVAGIYYAANNGADIINLSLGGSGGSRISDGIRSMISSVQYARNKNALVVAAAGNGGNDGIGDCNDALAVYPASINVGNVISVASINQSYQLSSFSNYGEKSVHIAAPGGSSFSGVLSTSYCSTCYNKSSYRYMSGTSMATPIVSGVLAVMLSEYLGASYSSIRSLLLARAKKIDNLRGKVSSSGYTDLRKALGL